MENILNKIEKHFSKEKNLIIKTGINNITIQVQNSTIEIMKDPCSFKEVSLYLKTENLDSELITDEQRIFEDVIALVNLCKKDKQ